jgi:methyl-accepting chemotaxis protein
VEQAAAAAASLQEQAGHLAHVVGVFKLDAAHSAAVAKPVRAEMPIAAPKPARPPAAPKQSGRTMRTVPTLSNLEWEEF